jgi:BirA family biotin operon repressor/biotin-[acetyl-CoA-carboxylase] ligase
MSINLKLEKVYENLHTEFIAKNIVCFKRLDSTNRYAFSLIGNKNIISEHFNPCKVKHDGTLIIAEKQYKGKGRKEKLWHSPAGGLWFTLILSPFESAYSSDLKSNYNLLTKITLIAAYAIHKALCCGNYNKDIKNKIAVSLSSGLYIKWPNDIYYKDRKLAGILAETEIIDDKFYLVTGIGINANFKTDKKLPRSLKAVSLLDIFGKKISRETLLAEILNLFEDKYLYFLKSRDFKSIFSEMENKIKYI